MSSTPQSAPALGISFNDLLRYNQSEAAKWQACLAKQPAKVMELPFGDPERRMGTVRDMLWHIFVVELLYSRKLSGEGAGGFRQAQDMSVDEIFAMHEEAARKLGDYLRTASGEDMGKQFALGPGRGGTARKFLAHVFVHSTRHWAQLATVLRQHGYQTDWQHDLVMSDVME